MYDFFFKINIAYKKINFYICKKYSISLSEKYHIYTD